jgi:hypothetical protein
MFDWYTLDNIKNTNGLKFCKIHSDGCSGIYEVPLKDLEGDLSEDQIDSLKKYLKQYKHNRLVILQKLAIDAFTILDTKHNSDVDSCINLETAIRLQQFLRKNNLQSYIQDIIYPASLNDPDAIYLQLKV